MKRATIEALRAITARFYAEQAESFSQTRRAPWPGWRRCLPLFEDALRDRRATGIDGAVGPAASSAACPYGSVLDLGCGNLRFESFLAGELPGADLSFCAVDSCDDLVRDGVSRLPANAAVRCESIDVARCLAEEGASGLARRLGEAAFDVAVAFGLLHHLPSEPLRAGALESLARCTRSEGIVAVSLWRFLDDPAMARKADAEHERALRFLCAREGSLGDAAGLARPVPSAGATGFAKAPALSFDPADLDPGDRLLGWKGEAGACRYCHGFSDADAASLIEAVAERAVLIGRFRSDGRTGEANEYLVFRVR